MRWGMEWALVGFPQPLGACSALLRSCCNTKRIIQIKILLFGGENSNHIANKILEFGSPYFEALFTMKS